MKSGDCTIHSLPCSCKPLTSRIGLSTKQQKPGFGSLSPSEPVTIDADHALLVASLDANLESHAFTDLKPGEADELRARLNNPAIEDRPTPCIGNDSTCPCADGLWCHYVDDPETGTKGFPLPDAKTLKDIAKLWADCGGDLICTTRCRYGYLDNGKGSEADPANCFCGRVALETALNGLLK